VPPALVAILGVGLAVYLLGLPTRTLGDMAHIAGGLPSFALPQIPWTWKPCASSRPTRS
jgi:SulP family sulfate permease